MRKLKVLAALLMTLALLYTSCTVDAPVEETPTETTPKKPGKNNGSSGNSGTSGGTEDEGKTDKPGSTDDNQEYDPEDFVGGTAFNIIEAESKVEGAALQIAIDANGLNLQWAEDVEKVAPKVKLSKGTVNKEVAPQFIAPTANADTNILEKFVLQIVLTSPVTTTEADISATIKGIKYTGKVRFHEGKLLPSDYVPTGLVLNKTEVTLANEAETTFTAKDSTYGLDYTDSVTWTLINDTTGSSINGGKFTAGSVDESATVTVRATLNANEEVYAEAIVTIDPAKADDSSAYSFKMENKENNGAFFNGEISWTDDKYAVTNISSKSEGIQGIINFNAAENKATFTINLTSGEFRGVEKTFIFRVKTAQGIYDVSVTYSDKNVTESGSDTEIKAITIEEAVLNPKIFLEKNKADLEKDGTLELKITYDEILDFDATKLSVESSDKEVVTAEIVTDEVKGTLLKLTGVKDGTETVTVKYDGKDSVTAAVEVSVVAELPPFGVEIITNDGAWFKIKVAYNDEEHKINNDNAVMTNAHLTLDGDSNANVSYYEASDNAVVFARSFGAANVTAAVEQTLTFRIQTADGQKYDFTVVFTGGKNKTITPTSVNFIAVKELVVSKNSLSFVEASKEEVLTISSVGLEEFDVSKVSLSGENSEVATVTIENDALKITSVANGTATLTLSYEDSGKTYTASVVILVDIGGSGIDWTSIAWLGDGAGGGKYNNKYKFYAIDKKGSAVNIQSPAWAEEEGIYVEQFGAALSACSLGTGTDKTDFQLNGASAIFFLKSFTEKETIFTVTIDGKEYQCAVYFADGTSN